MHGHPTLGVKNAKPRLFRGPGLAKERGELIGKRLAYAQLGYLLLVLRQRILALPAACVPRLVGLTDEQAIREMLRGAALAILEEIADLPSKVTDEHWFERLAAEEDQVAGERQQTPGELKAEQARAKRRREQKTPTMQKLRAEGRTS
jgi:hypothetical protein